jgi:hypothetical protein
VRTITAAGRRTECHAYQLWDGFDNYNSSSELWAAVTGTMSYSSTYARYATPAGLLGQGLKMAGGFAQWKQWNLSGNQATMIFGFAIYIPLLGNSPILNLMDTGNVQCSICITSSGAIQLQLGNGGTLLASSAPGVITAGVWHWLDIVVTINNTTGAVEVWLDQPAGGASVLNATGLDNRFTVNNYMNSFRLGDTGGALGGVQFDDFHAHDNTGSAPNSVIGDSRIYTKVGNAAGYQTQWTPNGASANWQCSDDSPPDGDTTYNASSTPGQIDGYAVPTAGFTGIPNGVVRRSMVRKDDGSTHTFQNGIRSSGTNGLGSAFTVPSSYAWTDSYFVNDPATSSPFTAAAADAAQMIIDETS